MTGGRGAWSLIGGTVNGMYAIAPAGMAEVGSQAVLDPTLDPQFNDFRAVNAAVRAIQTAAGLTGTQIDGWFGPQTAVAVRALQKKVGVAVDGWFGEQSAMAVFGPMIKAQEALHQIPGHYLCGIILHESGMDPGAVGKVNPPDKGLCQINTDSEGILPTNAFNVPFALLWTATRFSNAWAKYSGKGATLQRACSIVQHNSPVAADKWYATGVSPSDTATEYLAYILTAAGKFA